MDCFCRFMIVVISTVRVAGVVTLSSGCHTVQRHPTSPTRLNSPLPSQLAHRGRQFVQARALAGDVTELRLQKKGKKFAYKAGQFAFVQIPTISSFQVVLSD